MKITALQSVVHGPYSLTRGQEIDIPDASAEDLLKAGLAVKVKQAAAPQNKMAPAPANKAKAK